MAVTAHRGDAMVQMNGNDVLSPAFTAQLLRLYEKVVSGEHAHITLPPAAVERLKHARRDLGTVNFAELSHTNGLANGVSSSGHTDFAAGLPGLSSQAGLRHPADLPAAGLKSNPSTSLDPIFLQKSDELIRAEGQLKRERIERELASQVERRRYSARDKDPLGDASSALDLDAILATSLRQEPHISGLKVMAPTQHDSSPFDENDYYSSQDQSTWSSPASAANDASSASASRARHADKAKNGFADSTNSVSKDASGRSYLPENHRPQELGQADSIEDGEVDDEGDEDDEYSPPEAPTTVTSNEEGQYVDTQQSQWDEEADEDSEYEPGEITQESQLPTPYTTGGNGVSSPQVQVVRNHLTHIVAPQPNRVSPLAVAKGPSIELELVNGRPEVVRRQPVERLSSASPAGSSKKKRSKKRKREIEQQARPKKRRDRAAYMTTPKSSHKVTHIKNEPVSPPPFGGLSDPSHQNSRPAQVNLVSPKYVPRSDHPGPSYIPAPQYATRQTVPAPITPSAETPITYRPMQRDRQDLRRVASLHHAQRPFSPALPAGALPYQHRTASMTYGESVGPRPTVPAYTQEAPRYHEANNAEIRYVHLDRHQTPSQSFEAYSQRARSPAPLPVPVSADRIVTDANGNRYYLADQGVPAPTAYPHAALSRASVAPGERLGASNVIFDQNRSRSVLPYPPSDYPPRYEVVESRMGPPSQPASYRAPYPDQHNTQYMMADQHRMPEYAPRAGDTVRYVEVPGAQIYPVYGRPETAAPTAAQYMPREASIAPVQFMPAHSARAGSVMPSYERSATAHPVQYSQPPPHVQYVDQYGRPTVGNDGGQPGGYLYQ